MIGTPRLHLRLVSSTNERAGELARAGAPHGTLVTATEQSAGRGRQGRAWLAGNLCNAAPAADSVPAMIAAGAVAVVAGPDGRREVPVEQIPTGPGRTSPAKGELVVEFRLAPRPARASDAYLRFIPRTEMDIAVVGCGVSVTLDAQGVCTEARVSLGAVAPVPLLVSAAAEALVGSRLDDAALARLDAAAQAACRPITDKRGTIEYRTKIAGVLARRTAAIAFQRTTPRPSRTKIAWLSTGPMSIPAPVTWKSPKADPSVWPVSAVMG